MAKRSPEAVEAAKERNRIRAELNNAFRIEDLKNIYWTFTGEKLNKLPKAEIVMHLAELIHITSQQDFDAFIHSLPEYLSVLIHSTIHRDYIPIAAIEKQLKLTLTERQRSSLLSEPMLVQNLRIHCFALYDDKYLQLREPFRRLFLPFLPLPDSAYLKPIEAETEAEPEAAHRWLNDESRHENISLAIANLPKFTIHSRDSRVRGSFKKAELKELHAKIGLTPFPLSAKAGADPVSLIDSFICAFHASNPARPSDIDAWTKDALKRFFLETQLINKWTKSADAYTGASFEYYVLCPHLSTEYRSWELDEFNWPPSRFSFRALLLEMAKTEEWYALDTLMDGLEARNLPRSFWPHEADPLSVFRKAEAFQSKRYSASSDYDLRLYASGPLAHELMYKPLFAAYFYLMAIFGVVEIAEAECEATVLLRGKRLPVSPWSYLSAVRVSPFGRWCLGLVKKKPQVATATYEAIADADLLLVTFRGKSLERKLYLEQIGEPLGAERYRITEASFLKGCRTSSEIEDRIRLFTTLIEANPSTKWQNLFDTVRRRSSFYDSSTAGVLFDLGENAADFRAILAEDQKLAQLLARVEGQRVFVRSSDIGRFIKRMAAHGFLPPAGASC